MATSKPKQTNAPILTALLGKKIFFNGKFDRGEQDRLHGMAEAQGGIVSTDLDASVNYLVLPDLGQGKTVQKKMTSLNAKGATVQLLDRADFLKLITPTSDQVLAIIRGGTANAALLSKALGQHAGVHYFTGAAPIFTITGETFDGLDLSFFKFDGIAFDQCNFKGCTIANTTFVSATSCDFSKAHGESVQFFACQRNRFIQANLPQARFAESLQDNDFTAAQMHETHFYGQRMHIRAAMLGRQIAATSITAVFSTTSLKRANFHAVAFKSVDFGRADLSEATLQNCVFESASFPKAVIEDATFIDCQLKQANFTGANLIRANFGGSDLTNASVDSADVQMINLLGAKIGGVDFSKAQNYNTNAISSGPTGPALTELDSLCGTARRIAITFQVKEAKDDKTHEVGLDSRGLRWGHALRLPPDLMRRGYHRQRGSTMSLAMKQLAGIVPACAVQFGTIEASSTKSPKSGKELRELVINAISEAFNQPVPSADDLATATKAFRETQKEQTAADKERREKAAKLAEKQKISAKRIIAKKIEKEVGKVTDIATFLKALELRADKSKIDKATKMLKAEKFQLFNDITDTHLNGVVKSQTDADLVYACRIESDGHYACCTQNLNICGGLRGSICKHLLVLIIGLVKAGQLDPSNIDAWIAKSHDVKPELDKEKMGEIFIRYKGAEAGEVDWRPTETVPEDYYAV